MKFAFIILDHFESSVYRAEIHNGDARIIGVANMEEAVAVAKELQQDGVDCIELCGAFGTEGAKKIIDATGNTIPVGYVTHLPEQDDIYIRTFGN